MWLSDGLNVFHQRSSRLQSGEAEQQPAEKFNDMKEEKRFRPPGRTGDGFFLIILH